MLNSQSPAEGKGHHTVLLDCKYRALVLALLESVLEETHTFLQGNIISDNLGITAAFSFDSR